MLYQIVSVGGALLILAAYAGNQRGWIGPAGPAYNALNLAGALLLFWVALVDGRAGFIVLEAVWALVTLPPLWKSLADPTRSG